MADDLDLGSVGLSTQQAETAIIRLSNQFKKMNGDIVEFTKTMLKFNPAGRLVGATMEGINKQGDKIVAILEKTNKGWRAHADSITKVIPANNSVIQSWARLGQALSRVAAQQEIVNQKQLNRGLKGLGDVAQAQDTKTGNEVGSALNALARIAALQEQVSQRGITTALNSLAKIAQLKEAAEAKGLTKALNSLALIAAKQEEATVKRLNSALNALAKIAAKEEQNTARGIARSIQGLAKIAAAQQIAENKRYTAAFDSLSKIAAKQEQLTQRGIQRSLDGLAKVAQAQEAIDQRRLNNAFNSLARIAARQQQTENQRPVENALLARFPVNNIRSTASEINRLQAAIARASQMIGTGKIALNDFNRVLRVVQANGTAAFTGIEGQAARAIRSIIAAHQNLGAESARTTNGMLLSWESFGRLLTVQIAHKIVATLVTSFREGVQEAANFQVRISEIRTVAQANQQSFDAWSDSVRRLSDAFGSPLLDVAAGAYETLSNQVIKSKSQFDSFSQEVQRFSVATVSSTADSVNLLSSAMTSFGINTEESARVAAVFFKTIELGRVKANEMADTFGRMGPLASAVGISFEEVNAAIDTLTIRGTRFNDAATLINNVVLQLLKPSGEMKELLQEWGVTTGEAAIATFGFGGVLQKLEVESKKGTSRLAELFNEMRALRGIISLSGEAFDDFNTSLEASKNAMESYENAVTIGMESAGKKLQVEVNKIKNFFVADLGSATLNAVQEFSDAIGVSLSTAVLTLSKVGLGTAATLGTFFTVLSAGNAIVNSFRVGLIRYALQLGATGTSTVALTGATGALTAALSLNPVTLGIAAVAGSIALIGTAYFAAAARIKAAVEDYADSVKKIDEDLTKSFNTEVNKRLQDFREGLGQQFRAFAQYTAQINVANFELTTRLKRQLELSQEATKNVYTLALGAIKNQISEIDQQITAAEGRLKTAQEALVNNEQEFDSKRLQQEINFSQPEEQVRLIEQELIRLNTQFTILDQTGKFPEARAALKEMQDLLFNLGDRAGDAFKKADDEIANLQETIAKEKKDQANAQFNIDNAGSGFGTDNRNIKSQIESAQIIAEAEKRIIELQKEKAKLEQEYLDVKTREKGIHDEMQQFEERQLQLAQQDLDIANQKKALVEEQKRLAVQAFADFEAFNKDLNAGQFKTPDDALRQFDAVRDKMLQATQEADPAQRLALIFRFEEQRQAIKKKIETEITKNEIEELQRRTEAAKQALTKQVEDSSAATIEARTALTDSATEAAGTVNKLGLEIDKLSNNLGGGAAPTLVRREQLEPLMKLLEEIKANPTQEGFDAIDKMVRGLDKSVKGAESFSALIKAIADARRAADKLDVNEKALEAATQEAQKLGEELNNALPEAFQKEAKAAEDAGDRSVNSFKAIKKEVDSLITKVYQLQAAYNNIRPPSGGGAAPAFASGGVVPGGPRGTDTIPAWLSPGEFVVRERVARTMYPFLSALNSGVRHMAGGGIVQGGGDINITVNGGDTSDATVRDIAVKLRREIRRNSIRGFN